MLPRKSFAQQQNKFQIRRPEMFLQLAAVRLHKYHNGLVPIQTVSTLSIYD